MRRSIAAYDADIQAAQEDLRNGLVSLTAELAINYINVRSYQSEIAVTQASLAARDETSRLTVAKHENGLATELDAVQAKQTMQSTQASISNLQSGLQQSIHSIAPLLGEIPAGYAHPGRLRGQGPFAVSCRAFGLCSPG